MESSSSSVCVWQRECVSSTYGEARGEEIEASSQPVCVRDSVCVQNVPFSSAITPRGTRTQWNMQRTATHTATRECLCAERTNVISHPPTRHAKHVQTQSATLTATSWCECVCAVRSIVSLVAPRRLSCYTLQHTPQHTATRTIATIIAEQSKWGESPTLREWEIAIGVRKSLQHMQTAIHDAAHCNTHCNTHNSQCQSFHFMIIRMFLSCDHCGTVSHCSDSRSSCLCRLSNSWAALTSASSFFFLCL